LVKRYSPPPKGGDLYLGFRSYLITEIYIAPPHRRNHLAQTLVQEIEKLAKSDKYLLKLEVYEWNSCAIAFYKKCGFSNEGLVFEKQF